MSNTNHTVCYEQNIEIAFISLNNVKDKWVRILTLKALALPICDTVLVSIKLPLCIYLHADVIYNVLLLQMNNEQI
jgi:hypothetical protein